jgi:hypothetical protein
MNRETEARLSPFDLRRLPVVQAALAIEHPAPVAPRPALTVVPPALDAPEVEQTAGPLRPVAHWVLMPTGGGHARLEMVWETPDPLPLHDR